MGSERVIADLMAGIILHSITAARQRMPMLP